MSGEESRVTVESSVGVFVLRINEATMFSQETCEETQNLMCAIVDQLNKPKVVVDMSRVNEVGSHFFGTLVMVRKAVEARGGVMALAQLTEFVKTSYRVAGLHKTLKAFETVPIAVNTLRES